MFANVTLSRHASSWLPLSPIATALALSTLTVSPVFAQEPQNITVILSESQFDPKTITLTVGQPVLLNVQNQGKADHNLSSNDLPISNVKYVKADNSSSDLERYVATNVLNADALSGHTSMVIFTPTKAGTFGFFSEGEEELGMVGNFVVLNPGQAAPPPLPELLRRHRLRPQVQAWPWTARASRLSPPLRRQCSRQSGAIAPRRNGS